MGGPVLPSPSGKMKDRLNAFVLETPHTRSPTSTLAGEAIPRRRGDDIEAVYGESPFLFPILPLPTLRILKECSPLKNFAEKNTLQLKIFY